MTINGVTADLSVQEKGFAVLNREWKPGDQVSVTFPMKVRTSTWFNNSQAVEYGPLIFAVKVEEDWRIGTDDAAKEIQYDPVGEFDRKEVYPASDWNYGLVLNEADPEGSFEITAEDEISSALYFGQCADYHEGERPAHSSVEAERKRGS